MNKVLFIILISLFSLTIISCAEKSSDDGTTTTDDGTNTTTGTTTGTTAPVIAEVIAVTTPTKDTTPIYIFSSTAFGTITYGGSCSSGTASATSGSNIITLIALSDGTYSDCTITVTDSAGNASNTLTITSFTIDITAPSVSSTSPTDNQSGITITDNISVTFSESMDNNSVTTSDLYTYCTSAIQLSSDNFSTCVKMSSSPSVSNSNKTFTVNPSDNLSRITTYKIRVTNQVKDSSGNNLSNHYETSIGFTTWGSLQFGSSSNEYLAEAALDSSNNIYMAGHTEGGLDGNTNSGNWDIFLVKYNSSGIKQWTKQLGTSGNDYGYNMTVDSSDNIYVTGMTYGGLDGNTNSGDTDLYLVKYTSSGAKQWTQQLGTSAGDRGAGVTVDSSGNIYVSGYSLGGLNGNTNSGSYDLILVKYNSSGTRQWTQQLGSSASDVGVRVKADSSNNLYVTGYTNGGLDSNSNAGGYDIFLVKYNSSGTKQWTKQLGTSGNEYGNSLIIDTSDNIYLTGQTNGGLDGNTNSGGSDIFVVKYNSSGTKQWTKQLGTSDNESGSSVQVDSSDNFYLAGRTKGGLDNNTNSGGDDIFLVKYNSSGTKQWTRQFGTSDNDSGVSVVLDSSNNIYVGGYTEGGLDGNTNSGGQDIFLMKFNSDGVLQ